MVIVLIGDRCRDASVEDTGGFLALQRLLKQARHGACTHGRSVSPKDRSLTRWSSFGHYRQRDPLRSPDQACAGKSTCRAARCVRAARRSGMRCQASGAGNREHLSGGGVSRRAGAHRRRNRRRQLGPAGKVVREQSVHAADRHLGGERRTSAPIGLNKSHRGCGRGYATAVQATSVNSAETRACRTKSALHLARYRQNC